MDFGGFLTDGVLFTGGKGVEIVELLIHLWISLHPPLVVFFGC